MAKIPYKQKLKFRELNNTTLRRVYEYSTSKYRGRKVAEYVDGGQAYTYGSFHDAVERLSQRMSRYGISAGDKVAILSQNMPNYLVAFFSVTAFGRVVVPILPDSSETKKLRRECQAQGVPYLRFYYDHEGWWNTRSYVTRRTRDALSWG